MTAKEYLNQLTALQNRITANKQALEKYRSKAVSTNSAFGDISGGKTNTNSKIEINVEKIVLHEKNLESLCAVYENFLYITLIDINKIKDNVSVSLLVNKYINGKTWEEVTELLGFDSVDYVKKELHLKALKKFEEVNPDYPTKTPCFSP